MALERRTSSLVWLNLVGISVGVIGGAYTGEAASGRSDLSALNDMGTGALVGAVVIPGVGFWTDYQTGAAYRLDPARIVVRLEPESASALKLEP